MSVLRQLFCIEDSGFFSLAAFLMRGSFAFYRGALAALD
jgi:hypothetical protein